MYNNRDFVHDLDEDDEWFKTEHEERKIYEIITDNSDKLIEMLTECINTQFETTELVSKYNLTSETCENLICEICKNYNRIEFLKKGINSFLERNTNYEKFTNKLAPYEDRPNSTEDTKEWKTVARVMEKTFV
ncbi:hypothetical protein CDAR_232071 [Caerostris darwini]|uniref:Uncharacterized protein n=1 Tax=Caerostris darwini TaxID=1538125 RepID=A0AAV4P8W6_9ARAC|nr:hypothetical protein CDAR_232071 [Caerostris darwini]